MKKIWLVASLVLALALVALPAAAAEVSVDGRLRLESAYGLDSNGDKYTFHGYARTISNLKIKGSNGDAQGELNVKIGRDSWQQLGPNDNAFTFEPKLDSAWVETKGSFFEGTSSVTTRFGKFDTNFNDWIGRTGNSNAQLRVTGIAAGAANLNTVYQWRGANSSVVALYGDASLDVVTLRGGLVRHNEAEKIDYVIGVNVEPGDGIELGLTYAIDGQERGGRPDSDANSAMMVTGVLNTVPNMKLTAKYWTIGGKYDPQFRRTGDDSPYDEKTLGGYEVGIETEQAGLPLSLSFKSDTLVEDVGDAADDVARTVVKVGTTIAETEASVTVSRHDGDINDKTVLELARDFGDVSGSYKYTQEETKDDKHEVKVSVPVGAGVTLAGTLISQGAETDYAADATWKAQNGFSLGLHYATYDRGKWLAGEQVDVGEPGVDVGEPGKADGFSVSVGYDLTF